MSNTPKELKRTISYPNGHSSCTIEIDFVKRTFRIVDTVTDDFCEPEGIKEMYNQAGAFACEILNK